MAYFIGVENLDWNTFKLTFNLYEAKRKMNNIDYSKIRKKKINTLLTQLCRGESMETFLTNKDFGDSGMEFVYEWVKCQMKIYFYLYQNKKIKSKVSNNNNFLSGVYSHKDTIKEKINFDTPKDFSTTQTLRFGGKTTNSFKKTSYSVKSGTVYKQKTPFNTIYKEKKLGVQSQNSFLMTALPYVQKESKDFTSFSLYNLPKHEKINRIQNKEFNPIEARKIDIKLNGYDKYKDRIYREIKTAEMLPFLKNRTYHQMRDFFDIKIPLNKDIEKRHRKDINAYSMNGRKNEKKLMNLIAQGKGEIMNFLTLFKMKQIFSNYI